MTHSPLLRSDQTLFRHPDAFEPAFVPDHLHHRDAQTQELAFLIRPALRGGSALSAVLRGPPGTGKTTTVRRIFCEVAEETQQVIPVYVNCRHDHTPLAVYRSIFKALLGYAPPPTGWHLDDIKEGIARREHYFTFDIEVYRAWNEGASVWLDDDPDDGSRYAAYVQHLLPTRDRPERGRFRKRSSRS